MDVFARVPATVLFCCDFCLPVLWVVVLLSSHSVIVVVIDFITPNCCVCD